MSRIRVRCTPQTRIDNTEPEIECPNPMCDCECNVCYGKGFIHNPYFTTESFDDDEPI